MGLTEGPTQLLNWMVSGPELARAIHEFESSVDKISGSEILSLFLNIMTKIKVGNRHL